MTDEQPRITDEQPRITDEQPRITDEQPLPKAGGQDLLRRVVDAVTDLLPDGGIGAEGPAPDVDGRRDGDQVHKQAVLTAKSQMSSSGQATTSYEGVDRGRINDA